MLQKNYFFYLIILLVILQSCAYTPRNVLYVPEEHNALKVAQKNDIKAAFSTSNFTGEEFKRISHLNAQIAYSPIKHLGVFGNFLNWNSTVSSFIDPSFEISSDYKLGSGAVGGYYLYQTDKQKLRSDSIISLPIGFLFDAYLGIGRGSVENIFSPTSNFSLKMNKPYAQLGIHWQDEFVGISLVHRFGQIQFTEGVFNGNNNQGLSYYQQIEENPKQKFRETSFKLFMGTKEIRGYISFTNVNLTPRELITNGFTYSQPLPHADNITNIGVVLSIDEIYNFLKKNKK